MVPRNRLSDRRFRPIGWRGESYRHYLASKGISTATKNKFNNKMYFSRDYAKGNRDREEDKYTFINIGGKQVSVASARKSLNAQGYNAELQEKLFGIPRPPRKSSTILDVPDRDEISAIVGQSTFVDPFEQLEPTEVQRIGTEYPSEVVMRATAPVNVGVETDEPVFVNEAKIETDPYVPVAEERNVTPGPPPDPTARYEL